MKKYDAIIIGFGKGGKTLAGYLAGRGEKVALIEKSAQMYGGTCINVGCIPTKSFVNSANWAKVKDFSTFEEKAKYYGQAVQVKKELVEMLRMKNYHMLSDNPNITVYNGEGSFLNEHEVKVVSIAETITISGEKIFINTGSTSVIPPIKGIKESKFVYFSDTMLNLTKLPKELVIVGGGYIGLEFASFYQNFGANVTVIQNSDLFIPREDRDIAVAIQSEMEKQGVQFVFNAEITKIEDIENQAVVHFNINGELQTRNGDAVLIATGRKPNTANLNLVAAQIELLPNGGIKTDEQRRTNKKHIWAMGDVVGGLQFTYISLDDYRIVKSSLNGGDYKDTGRNVPYSVFIDPAFSRVGLSETQAHEKGYPIKVVTLATTAIPKAHVLKNTHGLLKAIVNMDTKQILGAALFCEESYEMINLIKLAMDYQLPYTAIRDQIFTHPTMSESLNDLFGLIDK